MDIDKQKLVNNQKRKKSASKKTTSKRTKSVVIGKQDYINQETGLVETFNVVSEKDVDFNFQKIWLGHLLDSLEIIGNKKIAVLNYLLAKKNSDNVIIGTQRVIAKESGVSLPTVNDTLKALIEINAIKKISTGVHMLNPDIIFKGNNNKRMNILLNYEKVEEILSEKTNDET